MQIEIENYSKKLKKKEVLKNINYEFNSGKIYGLHGKNGSGKTMILRAIAGLIFATTGSVKIDGKVLHKDMDFPPSVGVVIENMEMLPQHTGFQNLKIINKINNLVSDEQLMETLKNVELEGLEHTKVKQYSLGMKQKLSIAQAIFEKPKLLLLDEPTSALDESSVLIIRELLLKFKEEGGLIIIASHSKEDLAVLADEVLKIEGGEIV